MKHQKTKGEPVSTTSADLLAEQTAHLKELFPEAFTEGKVDFEKLRAALGDLVDDSPERYTFNWAGKRDAIRLLQTPTRATLVPCREESVNFDTTQHLFIEGDNLEVLKLFYKPYFGRVKMIYIDPPYNTGNDFIYPDNYADPLDTYLQITGQKDAEGNLLTSNPETSGRYHSAWLSMMYPRLFLARQLLREDGLIFVSIDDTEVANLRLMMNEIYGEENFVSQITWKKVYGGGSKVKYVVDQHEYIVCYARSKDVLEDTELPPDPEARKRYTEKDEKYPVRGPYFTQPLATTSMDFRPNLRFPIKWQEEEIWPDKQWQWSRERVAQALANNELVFSKQSGKWSVRYKQYLRDENGKERGSKPYSVIVGPYTQEGTSEIKQFFGDGKVFPFPKPSSLIKHFMSYAWDDENAIILDFFAGSCPTAQAVLELNREYGGNRRFIMVQLPEPAGKDTEAREAGFATIADIGKERIRRVIAQRTQEDEGKMPLETRETPEDLGFRVFKLAESNFRSWNGVDEDTPEAYAQQMAMFSDSLVDNWKAEDVIYEVALKEGYGLNCAIEPVAGITGNTVYCVADPDREQSFHICLDNALQPETLQVLNLSPDDLFICRDVALDDEAAANLALQCRLKSI
jgi:adenine-specific DNA-methyltransferase